VRNGGPDTAVEAEKRNRSQINKHFIFFITSLKQSAVHQRQMAFKALAQETLNVVAVSTSAAF
jgi:hypothetical protein